MSESIVRLSCCKENCGTFPMDRALYDKLKRTGESWCCPEGHQQHFTETTEDELREVIASLQKTVEEKERRISELESAQQRLSAAEDALDRRRDTILEYRDRIQEQRGRVSLLERLLLERAEGIVQVSPDGYKWSCNCGSRAQKVHDSEENARENYQQHLRRSGCEGDAEALPLLEAE